ALQVVQAAALNVHKVRKRSAGTTGELEVAATPLNDRAGDLQGTRIIAAPIVAENLVAGSREDESSAAGDREGPAAIDVAAGPVRGAAEGEAAVGVEEVAAAEEEAADCLGRAPRGVAQARAGGVGEGVWTSDGDNGEVAVVAGADARDDDRLADDHVMS